MSDKKFDDAPPDNFKNYIYTNDYFTSKVKFENLLDTAISSWSGFVYQGKVSIFHVLKNIDYTNYSLQLDSLDDFAILNECNGIESMHQVKAKKSTAFSQYKEAFEKLQNGGSIVNCTKLFFHLTTTITSKTITSIETDYHPIKIYKYSSDYYCEVDKIDDKIEDIIIQLLKDKYYTNDNSKHTKDYARKVRIYLDNLVVKKLFEIHRIIHEGKLPETIAAYDRRIKFSEFIEILSDDLNQKDLGDDYYLYQIKNDICRYYQEYCIENEPMNDELTRMNDFMLFFESLQKKDLIKFIKNIMPHRTFKFESLSDYKDNSPQQTEIKDVFIYILHQIEKKPLYLNRCLLQWKKDNKLFSPTCIIGNPRNTEKICDQIINNALSTDLDLLFENQNLITGSITVESMTASHIVRNNYQDDDKEYKHIMKWNEISLVCIDDAKGELND